MSTIIIYENLHPSGYIYIYIYIYIRIAPTQVLAKGKSVKRKGDDHHDSCIRVEDKSKR